MSLVLSQALFASTGSTVVSPPSYYAGQSGSMGEGTTVNIYIDYTNAIGSTVYWTITPDVNQPALQQADVNADLSSTNGYSGSVNLSGTGTYTVTTLTNIADSTTEGVQYYAVLLGTSPGASDLGYFGWMNINDTSQGTNPMPGGTGTPEAQSWNGILYTLTPSTNGSGNPGSANPGDVITWTITSSAGAAGITVYWWVDNNAVPANTWVENSNNGTVTLDSNGTGTFTRTVVSSVPTHNLFRMYVGMALYQGFVTHGYIGV